MVRKRSTVRFRMAAAWASRRSPSNQVSNYQRPWQWTSADADGPCCAGQAGRAAGSLLGDLALGAGGQGWLPVGRIADLGRIWTRRPAARAAGPASAPGLSLGEARPGARRASAAAAYRSSLAHSDTRAVKVHWSQPRRSIVRRPLAGFGACEEDAGQSSKCVGQGRACSPVILGCESQGLVRWTNVGPHACIERGRRRARVRGVLRRVLG